MNVDKKYLNPRTIFSVSLRENIVTLRISIPIILRLYPEATYFLICKDDDIKFFTKDLPKNKRLVILGEDQLITYKDFLAIYKKIILSKNYSLNTERLGWYYQQALKIIFTLQLRPVIKKSFPVVMFDADSIPLKRIQFFLNTEHSIPYGSLSECHYDYFMSLEVLFNEFKYPSAGFTTQFFSATMSEAAQLRLLISKRYSTNKIKCIERLVPLMVLDSTLTAHKTIVGSKFSEQELFGVANILYSKILRQTPIFSFRSWSLKGILSPLQMKILSILGVSLVTYENRMNSQSIILSWKNFIIEVASDMKPQVIRYIKIFLNQYVVKFLRAFKVKPL
jgi:hypothetical protein